MLFGWGFGITVGIIDMLKAFIPMVIVFNLFCFSEYINFLVSISALGAILGHCFPFFMNFNGGKGMACYLGMLFYYDLAFGFSVCVLAVILLLLTNYVAVATIIVLIVSPFAMQYLFENLSINFITIQWFISSIIILMHRENISKIINGTETTFWSVFKK